ncbi:MAG: hypothetical protein DMF38_14285 [Verrucomicrobia bacterium]|nr:MAG: hypothetical protein DMF38_14285 [Verrucomicrobiota bacterium]
MRLAFHPDRQESVRFLPEPCRNRNAGKVHGTVKKVKTDAMYPASVPRLLNILLRKLPGKVWEKVEESFRNDRGAGECIPRLRGDRKTAVADCIADCIWLSVPQTTERQSIRH